MMTGTVTTDVPGFAGYPYIDCVWIKPSALPYLPAAAHFDDEFLVSGDT